MNILVTLNKSYIKPLCVMLHSLLRSNPDTDFDVYVMNKTFDDEDYKYIDYVLNNEKITLHDIKVDDSALNGAPVTDRYPLEMYYRIFAARFLPEELDKILYLDPDLVVIKNIESLYNTDLGDSFFAAASHVGKSLQKIN